MKRESLSIFVTELITQCIKANHRCPDSSSDEILQETFEHFWNCTDYPQQLIDWLQSRIPKSVDTARKRVQRKNKPTLPLKFEPQEQVQPLSVRNGDNVELREHLFDSFSDQIEQEILWIVLDIHPRFALLSQFLRAHPEISESTGYRLRDKVRDKAAHIIREFQNSQEYRREIA